MIWLDKQLVAATNEFGETQLRPRITATGSRSFYKVKDKEMEKKREFYPMITQTVKTLISVIDKDEAEWFLTILKIYPDLTGAESALTSPTIAVLINELDRQYERWNKGGAK